MASKERAKRERQIVSAQGALDVAPSSNKSRYLNLPKEVKLFKPEKGKTYRVVFLPWKAGKHNPAGKPGSWVVNRFLKVHRFVGPGEEHYLCPQHTHGGECVFCGRFKGLLSRDNSKEGYKRASVYKVKDRELQLLHDLDDKDKNNIQLWDESVALFGDAFRTMYKKKRKWLNYADPEEGCVVEFDAKEKKIETGSCVECIHGIIISEREEPLPEFLLDAMEKLCPDDWVVETPKKELDKLFAKQADDEEEEEDEDDEEEEEEAKEIPEKRERLNKKKAENAAAKAKKKDEEEPDEDDEPEEPKEKKSGKKPAPKAKDEEEPEDEEDEENEEDEDEEEDEEEPEDEDEDDEEEEEVIEEPTKKRGRGKKK